MLHLKTHMTILGVIIFDQKVANLIETQKFAQNRLNHLILHDGSYSQFRSSSWSTVSNLLPYLTYKEH